MNCACVCKCVPSRVKKLNSVKIKPDGKEISVLASLILFLEQHNKNAIWEDVEFLEMPGCREHPVVHLAVKGFMNTRISRPRFQTVPGLDRELPDVKDLL